MAIKRFKQNVTRRCGFYVAQMDEYLGTVMGEELRAWLESIGQRDFAAFVCGEGLLSKLVARVVDGWRYGDGPVRADRNQANIECPVMQRRKTKPVGGIQSLARVVAPRHDMAGHQQAANRQPGYTAAGVVSRKHGISKQALAYALRTRNPVFVAGVVSGQRCFWHVFVSTVVDSRKACAMISALMRWGAAPLL